MLSNSGLRDSDGVFGSGIVVSFVDGSRVDSEWGGGGADSLLVRSCNSSRCALDDGVTVARLLAGIVNNVKRSARY